VLQLHLREDLAYICLISSVCTCLPMSRSGTQWRIARRIKCPRCGLRSQSAKSRLLPIFLFVTSHRACSPSREAAGLASMIRRCTW
jgi:hypothetical protein